MSKRLLMSLTQYRNWIKHNLLALAREHKATCKLFPEKCTVDLLSILIVLEQLGIKTTQKEREELA